MRHKNPVSAGRFGEDLALKYLCGKGYGLIARNHRIRGGEIDLILEKDGIIVFAEVKMRRAGRFGTAEDALTRYKKHKLLRTIRTYLSASGSRAPWRCDLIAIQFTSPREAKIIHYKNIFSD